MYKKILIIRLDRIGDVLLSTPVIESLRSAFPDSHIAMMVGPHAREIVKGNPYLDEVFIYDKENLHSGLWQTLKFALALGRKRFDVALVLHPTNRSHVIAFLAGIPRRVGYDKKFGFLLTDKMPDDKWMGARHESDYALDAARALGIAVDANKRPRLYFPLKEEDKKAIDRFLALAGVRLADTVVAIHPGASCPSKIWPAERFAGVADGLVSEFGAKIAIVSGTKDLRLSEEVEKKMRTKAVSLAGKTSLGELAALLKRSRLFISNDSGPVHVAVAVGCPVISIFGRKQPGLGPRRWGPLGDKDAVIHKDAGCQECKAHKCDKGFKCLSGISVEDVLAAARGILNPAAVRQLQG